MTRHLLTVTILLSVLLTTVGTTGCTDLTASGDEESAVSVVTFSATAAAMTRSIAGTKSRAATVPAGALSQDETFRVAATKTRNGVTTPFIPDDGDMNIVSYGLVYPDARYYDTYYGLTAWHTSGGYTWTADYTYNFYAVWPVAAPVMNFSEDCSAVTFSLGDTCPVDGDTDYLVAVSEQVKKNARGIPLEFRHAMSKITFRLSELNGVHATVHSIRLSHINTCGTYDFGSGVWTTDTPADYPADLDNPMLLLPQAMDEESCVVVEFKIQAEDDAYLRGSADEWATMTIPLTQTWLPGVSYVLTLTANYDIRLVTTIIDWETEIDDAFPDSYL